VANLFHELLINVNNSPPFIYHIGGDQFGLQKKYKSANRVLFFFSFFFFLKKQLIRRSDCQTSTPLHISLERKDLDQEWCEWIIAEEKKRLALLAFLWDVKHTVLFSQSLCMSAFELRLPLPYDSPTWEANSAEAWYKARKAKPPAPPFLMVKKAVLESREDDACVE